MSPRHALLFLACLVWVSPPGALNAANQPVRLDAHGDPLPPGVLLRLGTVRLRACARFLAFTPDGRTLVTGEYVQNCVVRFWDAATGIEKANFQLTGHQFPFALSPDGKTLAVDATQQSQAIVFLSAPDGKEIGRIASLHGEQGANLYFSRLDFSPDGKTLAAVGNDSVVRLFDVATGKTILPLTGEAGGRFPTAFSPDGKTLALVGPDNTLRLVKIAAQKEIFKRQVPRKPSSRALNISFSPDGKKLAWAGENERTFALWDVAAGQPVLQFRGPPETVVSVHFSPDGKQIAAAYTGEDGGSIRFWDAETGKELLKFAAPSRATDDLVFSPDGKQLAGGEDRDGVVHLWDVQTGRELCRVGEHQGFVCSVAFSPDGRTAFTGCADREVRVWDADKGTVARRINVGGAGGDPFSYDIVFSKDRKVAAVTDFRSDADLWDLVLGKKRARLDGGKDKAWAAVFAPDGKTLASRGWISVGGIQFWDAETGKAASLIKMDQNGLGVFAFSPDGKTLAVQRDLREQNAIEMSLWDVALGKELRKWTTPNKRQSNALLFSPDGRVIAATGDEEVGLWDAASGRQLPGLPVPKSSPRLTWMNCLAFSPDSRTVAVGDGSGAIYLWEVSTGRIRAVLTGHRDRVKSLDFSYDGARLISGSFDTTALIWDLTGLAVEGKPINALAPKEIAALWEDLADEDAGKAWRAGWRLGVDPAESLPFLREHVRPAEADDGLIARLVAALDSDDFTEREKAGRRLAELGDLAGPAVRKALVGQPSLEARQRLEEVVKGLDRLVKDPKQARALRCVEVLEHIGSAEARRLLGELGKGAPGSALTREAKASMARIDGRP